MYQIVKVVFLRIKCLTDISFTLKFLYCHLLSCITSSNFLLNCMIKSFVVIIIYIIKLKMKETNSEIQYDKALNSNAVLHPCKMELT